jgi:hypothetical protein
VKSVFIRDEKVKKKRLNTRLAVSIEGSDPVLLVRGAQLARDRDRQSKHGMRNTMAPNQMSQEQDSEGNLRKTWSVRFASRCVGINNGRETGRPFLCFQVRLKAYEYNNQKSQTKCKRKGIHLY